MYARLSRVQLTDELASIVHIFELIEGRRVGEDGRHQFLSEYVGSEYDSLSSLSVFLLAEGGGRNWFNLVILLFDF